MSSVAFVSLSHGFFLRKASVRQPWRNECPRMIQAGKAGTKQENYPLYSKPELYTRRAIISSFGALFGLSAVAHVERAMGSPLSTLESARAKLDEVDDLITSAKWDAVRTLLAKDPVNKTKEAVNKLVENASNDMRGALVGLREDLLSGIRLLDTSVYSNVFVGEDREILGTKVDYDVPRIYLADLKQALDGLIEIAELASE